MKKTAFVIPLLAVLVLGRSAQEILPGSLYNTKNVEKSFTEKNYYEMPGSFIKKGKIPLNSTYILFVSNKQYYGTIYEVNEAGQTAVKFNAFDREVFEVFSAEPHPCPVIVLFPSKPAILDTEITVRGVILATYLGMSGDMPVFQFSEGAFHRTVHEMYSGNSAKDSSAAEAIDIKSFNNIDSLRYSDSL
ncbi:MAG: hypothetical protein LBR47_01125 [Spirochaetaceae bacterium]|jgi:hypothetical protein|nr:hypothetical protein [Spirochaetaceae bacterium]